MSLRNHLLTHSTRELVWGTAVLAVFLYMVVAGRDVPLILGSVLTALVLQVAAPKAPTIPRAGD